MDKMRLLALAFGSAAAGAAGLAGAAVAAADDADPSVQLGQEAQVVDGGNIQGWTVNGLQPSGDAIPYQPGGTLWEATATAEAIAGGGLPFIPGFSARAANGDDYHALFQVPTAEGVSPSPLAQGQSTTGKLYFDVTGEAPNSVVFGNSLTWVQPPPSVAPVGTTPQYGTGYVPQTGYAAPQASGLGTGTSGSAAASGAAGQAATAQSTPAQSAPAKPAATAPAAAADDVHGAAVPAQPKQSTAPLDVHDTTAPPTTPAAPAQAPTTAAPAAPAPTTAAQSPAAALAAPAQPTVVVPTTVAPKPMSASGS